MKRIFRILLPVSAVLATYVPATAADVFATDPSTIMQQSQPKSGARGVLFQENMDSLFPLGFIRYTDTPMTSASGTKTSGSDYDWNLCSAWSDSNCKVKPGRIIDGFVVLGSCLNSQEIGCIENLAITHSDGKSETLKFVGSATSGIADIPQSQELGIPRSSVRPVYEDSLGGLYVVRSTIKVNISEGNGYKTQFSFNTDITRVSKVSKADIEKPKAARLPNNISGLGVVTVTPTVAECITIDEGICFKPLLANVEDAYTVNVRIPKGISGWINGRFTQPSIQIKSNNSQSQVITVSAKPAVLPIAGGWVKYADLPAQFMEKWLDASAFFDKNPEASYFLVVSPSQGDRGFTDYATWAPYLKEKALATVTNWSFATNSSGGSSCLSGGDQITGVVSSNASVYSSNPPTWIPATSSLSYQVASPHFDENGKENLGTYTLAISTKAIQCLYGQSSLPPSATVSIGYGSEVVTVATVTMKSTADWFYFAANGFHYSNPVITVKFAGGGKAPTTTGNGQSVGGSKIQWCAKGNAKKKVVAVNPVCPKGYKKILAPL